MKQELDNLEISAIFFSVEKPWSSLITILRKPLTF